MVTHNPPVPDRYLRARRRAIESLYCGRMSVTVKTPVRDPVTGIDSFVDSETVTDEPCRLCGQESDAADPAGPDRAAKGIRVMLAPEVSVPAGSTVRIEQHGAVGVFERSGRPRRFYDHQTIPLVRKGEYA